MNALVTGASGLVGRSLCAEFRRAGYAVTGIARSGGVIAGAGTVAMDLRNHDRFPAGVPQPDVVVHAAAVVSAGARAAEGDYADNAVMIRNLVNALRQAPPRVFILASTLDVYGTPPNAPMTESTPIAPRTAYAASKHESELMCASTLVGLPTQLVIARLTQLFGPNDRGRKFIPSVIEKLRAGSPLRIDGDGEDRRDYLFVDDAARMLVRLANRGIEGTWNLASGSSYSLLQVARWLSEAAGVPLQVEWSERRMPRTDYAFDVSHLRAALGDLPVTPIRDALKQTYAATH
jgi:nucleoside-diphosphate-sugar epimerase